jgi:hypothetical protein
MKKSLPSYQKLPATGKNITRLSKAKIRSNIPTFLDITDINEERRLVISAVSTVHDYKINKTCQVCISL